MARNQTSSGPAQELRKLISGNRTIPVPGVFSPSTALVAKEAGFKALYFSGAAFSGLLGLPDLGVVTMTEVAQEVDRITSMVPLPLIVDIDTGFGEVVNVARTVSAMKRAGAAAVQIEDQVMPKRCGHLEGKQLVPASEMAKKVVAAKRAASGSVMVIARTDAASVEGIDAAIERAKLYRRAGADVIFPEALKNKAEFVEFARKVDAPLLANMTEFGKTEYLTVSEFREMGYAIVIFPVTTFRVMMGAVRRALSELKAKGTQKALIGGMMSRDEFYELIGYHTYEELDESVRRSAESLDIVKNVGPKRKR